jgi:ubiquinone/menaquinone biosynthesis C-methylase UbiE
MAPVDEAVEYFTSVQASEGWGRVLDSFARFVSPALETRVLDVGCGPGALVRRFALLAARAEGCDSHSGMVERAGELAQRAGIPNTVYHIGALPVLPFDDASFDMVTATNVIFLLHDPASGLNEMARVCRPGGLVAMLNPSPQMSAESAAAYMDSLSSQGATDFNRKSFINWGSVAERHHRFSMERIQSMFGEAGLGEIVIVEKIGGLAVMAKGRRVRDEG